jgi:hypothetical protein
MFFSKNNKTRSSRKRSRGKMISKKRNMMRGGSNVFVKDVNGTTKQINISMNDTVLKLCDEVEDNFPNIRASEVSIIFAGRKLDPFRTLAEYSIQPDAIIYFVKKPSVKHSNVPSSLGFM